MRQDLVVVLAVRGDQVGEHERQRRLPGLAGPDGRRILVAPGGVDRGPVEKQVDLVDRPHPGAPGRAAERSPCRCSRSRPPRWPPGSCWSGSRSRPRSRRCCSSRAAPRPRPGLQVVVEAGRPAPRSARRRPRRRGVRGGRLDLDPPDGHGHLRVRRRAGPAGRGPVAPRVAGQSMASSSPRRARPRRPRRGAIVPSPGRDRRASAERLVADATLAVRLPVGGRSAGGASGGVGSAPDLPRGWPAAENGRLIRRRVPRPGRSAPGGAPWRRGVLAASAASAGVGRKSASALADACW